MKSIPMARRMGECTGSDPEKGLAEAVAYQQRFALALLHHPASLQHIPAVGQIQLKLVSHGQKSKIEPAKIVDIISVDATLEHSVAASNAPSISEIVTQF